MLREACHFRIELVYSIHIEGTYQKTALFVGQIVLITLSSAVTLVAHANQVLQLVKHLFDLFIEKV